MFEIFNTFGLCTVKEYVGQRSFDILGLYRPPKSDVHEIMGELQNVLIENFSNNVNVIIAGNFNIDLNSKTNHCGNFIKIY